MGKQKTLRVCYDVVFEEADVPRLLREAKDIGIFDDEVGANELIRRFLIDVGIEGAFPDEHALSVHVKQIKQ